MRCLAEIRCVQFAGELCVSLLKAVDANILFFYLYYKEGGWVSFLPFEWK